MRLLRLLCHRSVLASASVGVLVPVVVLYAAPGDQKIVKDYTAATGWSLIVPINVDGQPPSDYLSYNKTTGRAIVSVASGDGGEQKIVKDYVAATGWTSIVPIDVNDDDLTDLLSYNATNGRAIVSIATGRSGDQAIVKDYTAAAGWTALVPINVDGAGGTDLLSYNATTGRAIVSVAAGNAGEQKIVKDYTAAPGWTRIVPINVDHDSRGLTDYLSYNATTGRAIVSVATGVTGDQAIVKDYTAAKGWTEILPLNVDCDPEGRSDFLSYDATTGRAIVSVAVGASGDQAIVKDYTAAKGWTSLLGLDVDQDAGTDLLSYNATNGRAIVSVAESCQPPR